MSQEILISLDQHVATIQLNRPRKKNAITTLMYDTMSDFIEAAESDQTVRVIVLIGSGGNFAAGNDLSDMPQHLPETGATAPMRFITALVQSTVPMVAGVEGVAVGIGATMLLHLDSVVAHPDSRFLLPFVNLALVPEAGSSLLLPKLMGYTKAADLLMRGQSFDGRKALELGLVSSLADGDSVESAAQEIAAVIAQKPPAAVRKLKALLKGDPKQLLDRVKQEEKLLFECAESPEGREAAQAFFEKRPPDFC